MAKLHHLNLLPVLAHAVVQDRKDGRLLQLVYILFPLYEASCMLCIAAWLQPCVVCSLQPMLSDMTALHCIRRLQCFLHAKEHAI